MHFVEQANYLGKYPYDIAYNVCQLGNFAIHNFKYTDKKVLEIIKKENLERININQGYSNCSIAVLNDNCVVVSDSSIAKILRSYKINVFELKTDNLCKIHLYKNSKKEYSNMNGFIGGVLSKIDNFIFVSGDLNYIDPNGELRDFILNQNLKILDFPSNDIIDYGGILKI